MSNTKSKITKAPKAQQVATLIGAHVKDEGESPTVADITTWLHEVEIGGAAIAHVSQAVIGLAQTDSDVSKEMGVILGNIAQIIASNAVKASTATPTPNADETLRYAVTVLQRHGAVKPFTRDEMETFVTKYGEDRCGEYAVKLDGTAWPQRLRGDTPERQAERNGMLQKVRNSADADETNSDADETST